MARRVKQAADLAAKKPEDKEARKKRGRWQTAGRGITSWIKITKFDQAEVQLLQET